MAIVNRTKENLITHEYLLSKLEYIPETGWFIWKNSTGRSKAGTRAGNKQANNYRQIRLDNRLYLEHRLAWFYCFQEWPTAIIDHINRDPSDNKLDNLREATQTENLGNMGISSHNTSGFKGVSYNKQRNKYEAYISINNKKKNLGLFNTAEEAFEVYLQATIKYRGNT